MIDNSLSGKGEAGDDDDQHMANASKDDAPHESTPSSLDSSPEQDGAADVAQETTQPQKRKGGRKPIYATSEERKQRNRQAQAAFRERRTEYIKQLEATIKQNDETLSSLQQSHRTAADECLMLRYKNSLLERILLEKGVDVQAELHFKTGSPLMGTSLAHPGPSMPSMNQLQSPLQRAAVQRQYARRSGGQPFQSKLNSAQTSQDATYATASPQGVPTPSSHASSPAHVSARSPLTLHQGAMTPPASISLTQPSAQQSQIRHRASQSHSGHGIFAGHLQSSNASNGLPPDHITHHAAHQPGHYFSLSPGAGATAHSGGVVSGGPAYYPSPFQKHIDQLEQEYDTEHRSMLGQDSDPLSDHLHPTFTQQAKSKHASSHSKDYFQQPPDPLQGQEPASHLAQYPQGQIISMDQGAHSLDANFDAMGEGIDPNDPMLDADPFGLSASMHYPTAYSAVERQQPR